MPQLRRHRLRRDHRSRAPRKRKRRNLVKFIPEADSDFALVAQHVFLSRLKLYPDQYGVTPEDVASIEAAVSAFRTALARTAHRFTRNPQMVMQKDEARGKAEAIVRRYANIIRANPDVTDTNKRLLRLKVRPKKLRRRRCPTSPPRLQFLGSVDGVAGGLTPGSGSGVHVLAFRDYNECVAIQASSEIGMVRRAKPDGAVRIELYFDMVPPGEPVPRLPGERGWPKYLRSFTRNPIEVEFPVPSEPMLLVYWARWADSSGEVSRWSRPCVARVEGWTSTLPALPEGESTQQLRGRERVATKYVFIQTPIAGELPDHLEGDEHRNVVAHEIAQRISHQVSGLGQRMLDAATANGRMLGEASMRA